MDKLNGLFNQMLKKRLLDNDKEVNMETKSRYEVISDMEKQKSDLIRERESFDDKIDQKEDDIIETERELEDKRKVLNRFKESVESRKNTINELIKGINESLERLSKLNSQKK
jgi:chromosome segregation ATPase